jgi:transposase-like protein
MIYQSWQRHWDDLSEFFKYPPEIRKAIYTTNAVESLNFSLRKVINNTLPFFNIASMRLLDNGIILSSLFIFIRQYLLI